MQFAVSLAAGWECLESLCPFKRTSRGRPALVARCTPRPGDRPRCTPGTKHCWLRPIPRHKSENRYIFVAEHYVHVDRPACISQIDLNEYLSWYRLASPPVSSSGFVSMCQSKKSEPLNSCMRTNSMFRLKLSTVAEPTSNPH